MRSLLLAAGALLAACAAPAPPDRAPASSDAPYALVLGTAQDAGLPQIGCDEELCRRARAERGARRLVTSLLVVDPRAGRRFLVDATPDLPEQVERMRGEPPNRALPGPRPPLVDGILLTHAHMGHYAGLLHLGREAYGARGVPVLCSARMAAFLRANAPWSLLVEQGAIALREITPGAPVMLTDALTVTALAVPHRDELSDTLAFVVRGPDRALLYLPDIDKWERWERPIEDVIAGVDVALLDGSFYGEGEVAGRDMASIPHPFIVESLARFAALPPHERQKIAFTHLNHTNPASDPTSDAAREVEGAGLRVARDGERIGL